MARRSLPQSTKDGILSDLALGVRAADIATKYGVSIPTVFNYKNRAAQSVVAATVVDAAETATATAVAPVATRAARKNTRTAAR